MFIIKVILAWLIMALARSVERFGAKTVVFVSASIIMVFFGDTLVPILLHLYHILVEIFESVFEHALESIFGLNPKQSEFIAAWVSILLQATIGFKVLKIAYRLTLALGEKMGLFWDRITCDFDTNPARMILVCSAVTLSTFGGTLLLFS